MKTWQMFILLAAIVLAPHLSVDAARSGGLFYLVVAVIFMFLERK